MRILQTDDVRPATKHASDAIVAGWVLGGRGDLTRDLEDTAHVKRSTRRRAFKWSFNFVVVRRAYHIRHHARCAHHGIVRLDTVFGHTNERASVVRVPKEAWLTTQSRGAEFELIGEFCVMRDVLGRVLCIVSLSVPVPGMLKVRLCTSAHELGRESVSHPSHPSPHIRRIGREHPSRAGGGVT